MLDGATTNPSPSDRLTTFFDVAQPRAAYEDVEIDEIAHLLERCSHIASKTPRLYIILRTIGELDILSRLLGEGFDDQWFPVYPQGLPHFLSPTVKSRIVQSQNLVLTKSLDLEKGRHRHFKPGEALPFNILGRLGTGGCGQVDRIESKTTFRQFALKRIRRPQAFGNHSKEAMKRFLSEIQVVKALHHRHVIEYIGSYTDKTYLGIVMSPVADTDLASFLDRTAHSVKAVIRDNDENMAFGSRDEALASGLCATLRTYFGCLAAALAHLHDRSIRHKDIKPQNILVDKGNVLLADFGLSREFADDVGSTTSGVTPATRRYCPPEVAEYESRNTSADIWSLGCVFFEMYAAMKGYDMAWVKREFGARHTGSVHYYANHEATSDLIQEWEKSWDTDEKAPLLWIKAMMQIDRLSRPTAAAVLATITCGTGLGHAPTSFCGICCVSEDASDSEDSLEDGISLSSLDDQRHITSAGPPSVNYSAISNRSLNHGSVSITTECVFCPDDRKGSSTAGKFLRTQPNDQLVSNLTIDVKQPRNLPFDQALANADFVLDEVFSSDIEPISRTHKALQERPQVEAGMDSPDHASNPAYLLGEDENAHARIPGGMQEDRKDSDFTQISTSYAPPANFERVQSTGSILYWSPVAGNTIEEQNQHPENTIGTALSTSQRLGISQLAQQFEELAFNDGSTAEGRRLYQETAKSSKQSHPGGGSNATQTSTPNLQQDHTETFRQQILPGDRGDAENLVDSAAIENTCSDIAFARRAQLTRIEKLPLLGSILDRIQSAYHSWPHSEGSKKENTDLPTKLSSSQRLLDAGFRVTNDSSKTIVGHDQTSLMLDFGRIVDKQLPETRGIDASRQMQIEEHPMHLPPRLQLTSPKSTTHLAKNNHFNAWKLPHTIKAKVKSKASRASLADPSVLALSTHQTSIFHMKLFGVRLTELSDWAFVEDRTRALPLRCPTVIYHCGEYLLSKLLHEISESQHRMISSCLFHSANNHIALKDGDEAQVRKLMDLFESENPPRFDNMQQYGFNFADVETTLHRYLFALPDRLIPKEMSDQMLGEIPGDHVVAYLDVYWKELSYWLRFSDDCPIMHCVITYMLGIFFHFSECFGVDLETIVERYYAVFFTPPHDEDERHRNLQKRALAFWITNHWRLYAIVESGASRREKWYSGTVSWIWDSELEDLQGKLTDTLLAA